MINISLYNKKIACCTLCCLTAILHEIYCFNSDNNNNNYHYC